MNTSTLRVGRVEKGYIVQVKGRGTMRESRTLHEFAIGIMADKQCTLVVDLTSCEYLDSTFLGCLVDLYKKFRRGESNRFHVVANEERSKQLLAPTRLHQVLPVLDSSPLPIVECLVLQPVKIVRDDLGRHIMECHRQLAEIGGPNQEIFSRIAEQLEAELNSSE